MNRQVPVSTQLVTRIGTINKQQIAAEVKDVLRMRCTVAMVIGILAML